MQIPINFRSAELLTQSLCMTITDSVIEAGSDAEVTVEKLHQASTFAHELARFLDRLGEGIRGEIVVTDDTDDQAGLRAALAAARSKVTALPVRGVTDSRSFRPDGAA